MSDVATIRSTSGTGVIRVLKADEQHLLRDHLLRLDPASRHDRFNGGISEEFLKGYAARSFENGTIVIAYLQAGVVRGAAELHAPERSLDGEPEIAFSVESRIRRQGVGSALFEQLLQEAQRKGYARLRITTGGQNEPMKALASKFGAHLSFRRGEATGTLDLARSPALAAKPAARPAVPLSLLLTREMIRSSQTMWRQLFRFYNELLDGRQRLGTR
ncbi:MAG: GNAT family N-acetyltransferase [Pseudomonadota bacterium]